MGNKTAAAIDFYYKNLNLFVFVESDDLDYSPLYKFSNYSTFSCTEDLKKILDAHYAKLKFVRPNNEKKLYFTAGSKLSRWKKIIKL